MTPEEWAAMRKLVAQFIDTIADVRWRVERLNAGVKQKGTTMTTGCNGGYLTDPRAYFFTDVLKRQEGSLAPDWKAVLESLPAQGMGINPSPGEIQPPDAPFYGITVMIDGGGNARGRIWLPTATPVMHDGNAWYTHEFQVIADGPTPGSFVWAWQDKGGAPYSPHACDSGSAPGPEPTPPPSGGVTTEQVQQMINDALAPVYELLAQAVMIDNTIGLQAWGNPEEGREGKILCAEGGGPAQDNKPFQLTSRSGVGAWESWKVRRGQ